MSSKKRFFGILTLALIGLLWACSTEKNTFINRTYHSTTARYNGYFNATVLITEAMNSYEASLKEDFYSLLPIYPAPNEEEVLGMYPAIDTAISKCTKVIQRHSMPSNDNPAKKKVEHNKWIDENWTTVGIADFYRRDYEGAMKAFLYVRKFYKNDPSLYVGELWMARTNIEMGKYTEANFNLANLEKALTEEQEASKDKEARKLAKENKVAKFPKKIRFDLWKTKALLAIKKDNDQDAIRFLEESLKYAKKSKDKARVYYILGQLNERSGNRAAAKVAYSKVLKYTCPYQMEFNARLKRAFMGGDDKVKKQLMKMLRDAKNAEYKDQIYYALADIELQKQHREEAKAYLTKSAFYSTSNARQKSMSYEKLGNLSFEERNYIFAQKYYDSCVKGMPDNYPNAEGIQNKAIKLADLVAAVEIANYEDSIQKIARMSESEQKDFVKKVIKKEKEDEEIRKKRDAQRLLELQKNQAANNSSNSGKWYFTNAKLKSSGYEEFRKLWGNRDNEDDWRRSEKIVFAIADNNGLFDDTSNITNPVLAQNVDQDSLKEANYFQNIPKSDSAMSASMERLLGALYTAGVIYKDQLNEPSLAEAQFQKVKSKQLNHPFDLSAAFQLYKMNETRNAAISNENKQYILDQYPDSDYANYLRDPDFYVKRKEMEALAEQTYLSSLDRYNRGIYYPVISKATLVIENEPKNQYRAKFMLLRAMATAMTENDKNTIKPLLDQLIAEYPETPEAKRAEELLLVLKNGYSKNEAVNFKKDTLYKLNDDAKVWVMIFLKDNQTSNVGKVRLTNFNKEYFSREKLKVSSKLYGDKQESIILVQEFNNADEAMNYVRIYKRTKKHLLDLQDNRIIAITQENMQILFQTQKLEEYLVFFEEFY